MSENKRQFETSIVISEKSQGISDFFWHFQWQFTAN